MTTENLCAMPSVDERIENLRRDVNALYRLIPDNLERELEEKRKQRWHETYNAALQGMLAGSAQETFTNAELDAEAIDFAERRHGPLEAKEG